MRFLKCDHCGHAWQVEHWIDMSGPASQKDVRHAYEIQQQQD
jgi:hypothetical protein